MPTIIEGSAIATALAKQRIATVLGDVSRIETEGACSNYSFFQASEIRSTVSDRHFQVLQNLTKAHEIAIAMARILGDSTDHSSESGNIP
jgi:hypothetical protein